MLERADHERLEELFRDAVALTPRELDEFVARLREDEPDLARVLERLLQIDGASSPLDVPAVQWKDARVGDS